jgi:hypothetical protein
MVLKAAALPSQPAHQQNDSCKTNQRNHWAKRNVVGKGKKVITESYKPLTIQKSINLMLKAIHRATRNNI